MTQAKYLEFGNRLKELMSAEGSKVTKIREIQDYLGVTYEMARRYTLGTAKPREDKLQKLADLFNVDISYLDHGANVKKLSLESGKPVPVISWVQAGSWTNTESVYSSECFEEWLPPNKDCGMHGYGLKVAGVSMMPDFRPDDRIYVNPEYATFDLKTNDLVIVSCAGDSEATFKKLIIEGSNRYLQPLNPEWPEQIIKLTEDCRLVGKVIGLYRRI